MRVSMTIRSALSRAVRRSQPINDALSKRAEQDRRIARRWEEVIAGASDADRARAARMRASIDAQAEKLPLTHRFR